MLVFSGIAVDTIGRGLTPALALSFPEFERVSLFKTLVMSAVGAETG